MATVLSDSAALNSAIIGVVAIVTLILRRVFARRDTAYDNMMRDARWQREQLNWQRAVINLMDQEIWDLRKAAQSAGIHLEARKEWPPPPDDSE